MSSIIIPVFIIMVSCIWKGISLSVEVEVGQKQVLTLGPVSTAVEAGDQATLFCSSNESISITWSYTTLQGVTLDTLISNNCEVNPAFSGIYAAQTDGIHDCNIIVLSATRDLAGVYHCKETLGFAKQETANLVIIDSTPDCTINITGSNVMEDDMVLMKCNVTYTDNLSPMLMSWTDPKGQPITPQSSVSSGGYTESFIIIRAVPPTVEKYSCLTYFDVPDNPPTTAQNAPEYKYTFNFPVLSVTACPTDIQIAVSEGTIFVGDQLTCLAANGHSPVTYMWTLQETGAVTSGQTITLTHTGTNTYSCSAAVIVQGKQCTMSTVSSVSVTASTCRQILDENPKSASMRHTLTTSTKKTIEVYCEMGLNGGGYTFLHPRSLLDLTDAEVQEMFTDRTNFLMRYRYCDKTYQPYAVLKQLSVFSDVPLYIGLTSNEGYFYSPLNSPSQYLGTPFLFFGFLPTALSTNTTTVGLLVNDVNINATKTLTSNPYNYFNLLPGFQATTYRSTGNYALCNTLFGSMINNPTGRDIPAEFFMFYEALLTSICYANTYSAYPSAMCVNTVAIGFR